MRQRMAIVAAVGAGAAFIMWWRSHPRTGAQTVNRIVNPWLVRQGVTDATRGEIGLLEHVGRVSGTVRVTPIRPVDTADGVRIVMPLGEASEWGRNVLAAGHCRLQRGQTVLELDTPRVLDPREVDGVPRAAGAVMAWLGFRYLSLRRFREHEGTLSGADASDRATQEAPADGVSAAPIV